MSRDGSAKKKGKTAVRVVAANESYSWGNLTLAVQLLLPLAFVALLFARKKIWIYPYPLLDTYISALCPSFSQQQRLLKWMSSRIPHMNSLPNKITQYWQNGSLLCTLINTVVPGACSNPQKHWKKPPTHGQALAYKYLGVTPVLAESDLNNQNLTSYSERKFIKYLLSLQDAINKVTIEEDTLKFTSRYVARGMGLVIGEQNRPSFFYVYPNTGSNRIENILVNIKGPYNTFGAQMISSSAAETNDVNKLIKIRKENLREQQKLQYKSKAQRSFFRSVSFDISPIMNLVTSRRNSGEIAVKVEMENDRAKVTFLPKFSGIYELLLTNDGQHLQGSPFIIRIMKNTKEVEHALQETTKINKGKIERKIISKSIDFINESVNVTEEDGFKLDTNNNANAKDPKETTEANKSDDESSYQDSGVFDISESANRCVRPIDLEEIDEDSRFSEISDANTTDESKYSSLEYKMADDNVENSGSNINNAIRFNSEEAQEIIVHSHTPDDIKFLANDVEQRLDQIGLDSGTLPQPDLTVTAAKEEAEEDIFNDANDSESNQEFENLYNKIANDECAGDPEAGIETLDKTEEEIAESETKSASLNAVQSKQDATSNEAENVMKIVNNLTHIASPNNLEDLPNTSEIQNWKGRVTSSIERMVEIFEKEPTTKINRMEPIDAAKLTPLDLGTAYASPIFSNIAQEAIAPEQSPSEDSTRLLKEDYELSSKDKRTSLTRDYSICLDDDDIFNTNVKEIKRVFEVKPEIKAPNKRFATTWRKQDGLQEAKNKLAKSMPNLNCDDGEKNLMEEFFGEDEFLLKFKKKRNFWNNLISQNSQGRLNVSNSEINLNNAKLMSERCSSVSQSVNCLNTLPRSNKPSSPLNKYKRKKEELHKATSLDLANTYDDEFHTDVKNSKIVRAHSLYDRIRIFDKDFDMSKHTTLLKRTKERAELKEIDKHPEIPKPESLTDVPNKTSNDQIEEDLRFAEIMKERFEMSKRFFCSLEIVNAKPNLSRRHSMDSKPQATKEVPLQKGGSLKVLNVFDKFAMDNIYKDVIFNKIKNSNFRGSPNRDAVVETLSSVSSGESNDFVEKSKDLLEEEDLNLQFFNVRKRLRKRRSIKSIFDINY